jgi:uncharacterized protein (TIGR00255 family)
MSVYSMTGYASASADRTDTAVPGSASDAAPIRAGAAARASIEVELRSVNSRFLDLAIRLPDEFRSLEPALRELLSASFRRGKVELRLNTGSTSESAWPHPLPEQLSRLGHLQNSVQTWLPSARELSVHEVLQWCKGAAVTEGLDSTVMGAATNAVSALKASRAREGQRLGEVLLERIEHLRSLAERAVPLVPAAVKRQEQKFLDRWEDALKQVGAEQTISRQALQERAINEAAAFAIRIDVAEEVARLRAHIDEMGRLLKAGGEVGKRLDFLIQELLREANTLASKASSLELTNVSVEMKVVIEQLREQVQNLE